MKLKYFTTVIIALNVLFGLKAQNTNNNMDNYTPQSGDVKVLLKTTLGDITILLYGDTPRHRDNFVKLVKEGHYDGVLFHRVINDFMVQTGDPNSKNAPKGKLLGDGDMPYEIEAEFLFPTHYHHRGALAAARQGDNVNPERKSSASQFYIVTGKKFSEGQLDNMEHQAVMRHKQEVFDSLTKQNRDTIMSLRRNRDQAGLQALQEQLVNETEKLTAGDSVIYTPEMRQVYMNEGGTPHLDGTYTVFGRVLSGMDVVDKIQKAETDGNDRPIDDIRIISATILPEDK